MIQLWDAAEQIRRLDDMLWLQGYACSSMKQMDKELAYFMAIQFGTDVAANNPVDSKIEPNTFDRTLLDFGVNGLHTFSQKGEAKGFSHAYYNEPTKEIAYDETFAKDIIYICTGFLPWKEEDIRQALLLHELFHHLENTCVGFTPDFIANSTSRRLPKSSWNLWRDIAAFAFVHTQRPDMYCQLVDLCWMKKHMPDQYATILPNIQMIIPDWNI